MVRAATSINILITLRLGKKIRKKNGRKDNFHPKFWLTDCEVQFIADQSKENTQLQLTTKENIVQE